jgi:hypothetical protein
MNSGSRLPVGLTFGTLLKTFWLVAQRLRSRPDYTQTRENQIGEGLLIRPYRTSPEPKLLMEIMWHQRPFRGSSSWYRSQSAT